MKEPGESAEIHNLEIGPTTERAPPGRGRIGYIRRKMSPLCNPLSKRPCITVCTPAVGSECAWDDIRQNLIQALQDREGSLTVGNLKAGCSGHCANGPMVGFPHKEFFYIGCAAKGRCRLAGGIEKGSIRFDLLSVNWRRSYRSDIFFDMQTGFLAAIDDSVCMVQVAKYFLDFQEGMSCGKCIPCRVWVQRARESIGRLISGKGTSEDIERLKTLCFLMEKTFNCDYAHLTVKPVLSAVTYFEKEFAAHVEGNCCAGICAGSRPKAPR